MGEGVKDFAVGAGATLAAELASNWIRSIWSKDDETRAYKSRLTRQINLARATIEELPDGQTIKNKYLKAWRSDLIEAANEGDIALQSSTADAEVLKSAFTKLKHLTKDAKTYLTVLESGKKKATLDSLNSIVAAYKVNHELAFDDPFGFAYFGFLKLEKKEPLNSAAVVAAGNPEAFIARRRGVFDDPYRFECGFFESEMKEPPVSVAAGNLKTSLFTDPFRDPRYGSEDYVNKKRMSSEPSLGFRMWKMAKATTSKRQRGLEDSLVEELEKNSSWLYDIDSTGRALIYDGEQSINDRTKMKGKCPEGELDEETGHGKANILALSCSPCSSYGGANDA